MPIYEFYCADCHRLFRFLSRRVNTRKRPDCPRCGRKRLDRRPSAFAVSTGVAEERGPDDPAPSVDEARLESAVESMAAEMASVDGEDPRQGAGLLRRLYRTAGLRPGPGMDEALRRLEAGEDPEAIEERLGDALDEEPLTDRERPGDRRVARGRTTRPSVDPELHEL